MRLLAADGHAPAMSQGSSLLRHSSAVAQLESISGSHYPMSGGRLPHMPSSQISAGPYDFTLPPYQPHQSLEGQANPLGQALHPPGWNGNSADFAPSQQGVASCEVSLFCMLWQIHVEASPCILILDVGATAYNS